MRDRLLKVEEAAEMLAVKKSTLYTWAYEKKIPSLKLGGSRKFRLSDIERVMKNGLKD